MRSAPSSKSQEIFCFLCESWLCFVITFALSCCDNDIIRWKISLNFCFYRTLLFDLVYLSFSFDLVVFLGQVSFARPDYCANTANKFSFFVRVTEA